MHVIVSYICENNSFEVCHWKKILFWRATLPSHFTLPLSPLNKNQDTQGLKNKNDVWLICHCYSNYYHHRCCYSAVPCCHLTNVSHLGHPEAVRSLALLRQAISDLPWRNMTKRPSAVSDNPYAAHLEMVSPPDAASAKNVSVLSQIPLHHVKKIPQTV